MHDQPRLLTQQDGRVLTVTFNHPPRHFFDPPMAIELDELTRKLRRDKTIGAVVFTGTDDTYLTHLDMPSLARACQVLPFRVPYPAARAAAVASNLAARSAGFQRLLQRTAAADFVFEANTYAALRRMNAMDKVFLTAINGLALGAGCVFALACDIRVVADDVQIGLPESALDILAAGGGSQRLVRMVGAGRALGMLLEGEFLTAEAAHRYGLVHRVVARSDLAQEVADLAQRLATRSPLINREIKRMVYRAADRRFAPATRIEAASLITTATSGRARQKIRAYHDWLAAHPELPDAVIETGFEVLRSGGMPATR
jgi:enoyl-CoA hydratase/carnithine racemase